MVFSSFSLNCQKGAYNTTTTPRRPRMDPSIPFDEVLYWISDFLESNPESHGDFAESAALIRHQLHQRLVSRQVVPGGSSISPLTTVTKDDALKVKEKTSKSNNIFTRMLANVDPNVERLRIRHHCNQRSRSRTRLQRKNELRVNNHGFIGAGGASQRRRRYHQLPTFLKTRKQNSITHLLEKQLRHTLTDRERKLQRKFGFEP